MMLIQIATLQFVSANETNGQSLKETQVSISVENASLEEIISLIENQTDFVFTAEGKMVGTDSRIDLKLKRSNLKTVLDKLAGEFEYNFKRINQNIYVWKGEKNVDPPTVEVVADVDISGKITDENGEGLPGASVIQKGTANGTTTGLDGQYKLNLPENAAIVISFVGYRTTEVAIAGRSTIDIQMELDAEQLEEVVVVGFGEQKKVNLTGSVVSVGGQELNKRPTPNVTNLLQGKVSGVQMTQPGGTPGDDGAEIRIRGLGTFSAAGSGPLVLIDGVQGNMSDLDANSVESISVLKDAASAAIYGARAANGVILVTTKKGKAGDISIELHSSIQAQKATTLPDLVTNSADYMEFWNVANERAGQPAYFTQAEIDAFRNNPDDPVNYPNFDWIDHMFSTAITQNHTLTLSGGSDKTTFNMSLGFLDQPGISKPMEYQRYNFRMALETKIKDWFTLGGNVRATEKNIKKDIYSEYQPTWWILHAFGSGPNYNPTITLPDGTTGHAVKYSSNITEWTVRNPQGVIDMGWNKSKRYNVSPQLYTSIDLAKDLVWYTKGAVNFDYDFNRNREHKADHYYFNDGSYAHNGGVWHEGTMDRMRTEVLTTFYSTLNYSKTLSDRHNFNVLAGYNQESYNFRELYGRRISFPVDNLDELNAGSPVDQTTSGTAREWAIRSVFGRLAYDFEGRYLIELNGRYDGTSRIAKDNRWGFFPSVSAGWRVSEESFLNQKTWLDNLKLRASWGQLGNQNVGNYPYQSVLSTTTYPFGSLDAGVQSRQMVDRSLTWETTSVTDFGFDASIKNGLFTMTVDWYSKLTDDILYEIPVPLSVGLDAPTVNGGKMKNTGWDFELGHNNRIGKVQYNVHFNLSTYKNEVLNIVSPSYGLTTIQEGLPYRTWFLTEWVGIFQSQAEIDAAPLHPFDPKPGDLKFKDQNNDGVIDADDRVAMDGVFPNFFYGGGINASWKNFDVSIFLQGVAGQKNYVTGWGLTPFRQGSAPPTDLAENYWTEDNPTNEYPAMYRFGYGPVDGTLSSFNLRNSSYLRLKNLRIGYTIPQALIRKVGLTNAHVYFSGDNLFTMTDYPGADPERTSASEASTAVEFTVFPNIKTYAFGVQIKL